MEVKSFLLECSSSPEKLKGLTRTSIFPLYIKDLNISMSYWHQALSLTNWKGNVVEANSLAQNRCLIRADVF